MTSKMMDALASILAWPTARVCAEKETATKSLEKKSLVEWIWKIWKLIHCNATRGTFIYKSVVVFHELYRLIYEIMLRFCLFSMSSCSSKMWKSHNLEHVKKCMKWVLLVNSNHYVFQRKNYRSNEMTRKHLLRINLVDLTVIETCPLQKRFKNNKRAKNNELKNKIIEIVDISRRRWLLETKILILSCIVRFGAR